MNVINPIRILITAGATTEPIDCVRHLGNRSSGQLGTLLAFAGAVQSYKVTLLLGPNCVRPTAHPRLRTIPFSSTRDLRAKVQELWPTHDVLIMAAAVSDFTPRGGQQSDKIRRGEARALDLVPTEDIVAEAAKSAREDQRIIAFALEAPDKLEHNALEKLQRKQVDAIVANPLETMDASCITAHIFAKHGKAFTPPSSMKKSEFAKWLILNLDSFLLLHG